MSAIDLPPGLGLAGTPLGTFAAPAGARRLALAALLSVAALGALTWYFASQHPGRRSVMPQLVAPVGFVLFALISFAVRSARVVITRDGVRWGWSGIGFRQDASRIACAHVYRDGVALEARRGSWWFLAARDWDRFDGLVRQLRRATLPIADHDGPAPLRARLQSYGRVLDGLLVATIVGAAVVALWAA